MTIKTYSCNLWIVSFNEVKFGRSPDSCGQHFCINCSRTDVDADDEIGSLLLLLLLFENGAIVVDVVNVVVVVAVGSPADDESVCCNCDTVDDDDDDVNGCIPSLELVVVVVDDNVLNFSKSFS